MKFEKFYQVGKSVATAGTMALINAQSLEELTADDVFIFRIAACDNQIDRDFERFTERTLADFAPMFVGKPVLMDHSWSATTQTARVFAAEVEIEGDVHRLVLSAYLPITEDSRATMLSIQGGILREVSVGCSVKGATCSICGAEGADCSHRRGGLYDGVRCHYDLHTAVDAYEVSFVAVPAQPGAGVVKHFKCVPQSELTPPPADPADPTEVDVEKLAQLRSQRRHLCEMRINNIKNLFGGNENEQDNA